jgi:hypothetical protein
MLKKLCLKCEQPSLSSSYSGILLCHTCNIELTSGELDKSDKPKFYIIKKQFAQNDPRIKPYSFPSFD